MFKTLRKASSMMSLAGLALVCALLVAETASAQKVGGNFNLRIPSDPTTLHPIMSTDLYSSEVRGYVVDTLLNVNDDTYEYEPCLAEKWEVSKDGLTYTFHLRDGAKFHDGTPVTPEDVKFSFDAIFIDAFKAAHMRPYYENIEKAEITDPHTVKFTAKKKYFGNLEQLASLNVVPKHFYSDPNAKLNKTLMGSGPYRFDSWDRGKSIKLTRNKDWWGWTVPTMKGRYNFETVTFRLVEEENVALEMLKKGDVDYMELSAEQYNKNAVGPEWGTKILKIKTENKSPKGYGFFAWNLEDEMFKDKNVRKALSLLVNRPLMNEKYRFNFSLLQTGPTYVTSDYASPKVKPLLFEPKKALELLKAAGWDDKDKNGVLEKDFNGQKKEFKFTLMTASSDSMKYLTMFKEDAKKVGVEVEVKQLEWNSFMKLVDEGKFQGMALAWGGGSVDPDLKQIWHSASAVAGGSNFIHYKNPEVDKIIDESRETLDKKKRIQIMHKAFEIVAEDCPYSWLFSNKFTLYAVSPKIKRPKDTFKYAIGTAFWSMK